MIDKINMINNVYNFVGGDDLKKIVLIFVMCYISFKKW